MDELGTLLRARGMRLTRQRERVVRAVSALEHATPEEVLTAVGADGGPDMPASTVYRCLEALEESGVIRHTHLDHRSPSYQLADHDDHIHLVCDACGRVEEAAAAIAGPLADTILAGQGFAVDLTHAALHGRCARCRQ